MQFSRTAFLLGEEGVEKLKKSRVAIFGIGGVGGYVAEALARSGVGALDLIDKDVVSISNINRQIIALHSTVGRKKTEVMAERVKDINPAIDVRTYDVFYLPETANEFDFSSYDYVVDAIDTVSGKIALVEQGVWYCEARCFHCFIAIEKDVYVYGAVAVLPVDALLCAPNLFFNLLGGVEQLCGGEGGVERCYAVEVAVARLVSPRLAFNN